MELISSGSIGKAIGTDKPNFDKLNQFLLKRLKLNEINELYAEHNCDSGVEFIDNILKDLNIDLNIPEKDLKKIPSKGPFITVSNHPFGAIDGLILIYIFSKVRPDFKAMANFLLENVAPIKDNIIPVNPFENKRELRNNIEGVRKGMTYLKSGHPIGIFPAGEVSSIKNLKSITDKPWNPSTIKFIKKSNVPVIPVYFHGANSISFHILGLINPSFRTAKLASELLNKRNKTINVRIGNIIDVKQQNLFKTSDVFGRFLRAKTYALGTQLDAAKFFNNQLSTLKRVKDIIKPVSPFLLLKDIAALPNESLLFTWGDYKIFYAKTKQIPNVILEIGRLREVIFREVKEGTGKALDIDSYDFYYNHLFIWDDANEKIVGGYRIGMGKEIIESYGRKGFYVNSLFKLNKKFSPQLSKSIELGRSFVVPSYQKKAFPLFCLWKGILTVLLKNKEYRYVIGPVTISSAYSKLSKNLIIDFIQSNHFDYEVSKYVKPRKKYKVKYKSTDFQLLIQPNTSMGLLDSIIEEIEIGKFKVPILFKKYLQQNASIIGFNRDPKFNNALDGLMLLDVTNIPAKTLKNLTEKDQDYSSISNRFYGQYHQVFNQVPQF